MKTLITILLISSSLFTVYSQENTFIDTRDSVTYETINLNNQTWFAENLKYYIKGSDCFDHDTTNCIKYGRLYTHDQAQNACPDGWRLPTQSDWESLISHVGGTSTAGGKLKTGGVTNFNIRMTGIRKKLDFIDYKEQTGFWSSTTIKETNSFGIFFWRSKPKATPQTIKKEAYRLSVRCIKKA